MSRIVLPSSVDEAVASLDGIAGLLTAKEWERAAIVVAFTTDGRGKNGSSTVLNCIEFAALGIKGLKSDKTVRNLRKAWESAGGDLNIKPGDTVTLPTADWGTHYKSDYRVGDYNARVTVTQVAEAIRTSPEIAEAAFAALEEIEDHYDEQDYNPPARKKSQHKPVSEDDTESPVTVAAEIASDIAQINKLADQLYYRMFKLREMGADLSGHKGFSTTIIQKLQSAEDAIVKPSMDAALAALLDEEAGK